MSNYGWLPDVPDKRDHYYSMPVDHLSALPESVDLRPQCPPVMDQQSLGSCTANAISAAIAFDQIKQQIQRFLPSRLFIYYNERAIEHTIASDSGAMIRDGIKSVNRQGACSEDLWPYLINRFTTKPPKPCYDQARLHKSLSYQRVPRGLQQMKSVLASGFPFVFGISVYESFESDEASTTGNIPMPFDGEGWLGGHALLCVGYTATHFHFQNSWSIQWGDGGYGMLPHEYLLESDLSDDFWCIRTVQ